MISHATISEKDRIFFLTDSIEDAVAKIRAAYEREEPMPNFYFLKKTLDQIQYGNH